MIPLKVKQSVEYSRRDENRLFSMNIAKDSPQTDELDNKFELNNSALPSSPPFTTLPALANRRRTNTNNPQDLNQEGQSLLVPTPGRIFIHELEKVHRQYLIPNWLIFTFAVMSKLELYLFHIK